MNLNELAAKCQEEIDNESLLDQCVKIAKDSKLCNCPEISSYGWCDDCPVENKCPSNNKDWTS